MCCSTDFLEENFDKTEKLSGPIFPFTSRHDYGSKTKNNAYLSK